MPRRTLPAAPSTAAGVPLQITFRHLDHSAALETLDCDFVLVKPVSYRSPIASAKT